MSAQADGAHLCVHDFRLTTAQELCLDLVRICMAQLIVVGHLVKLQSHSTGGEMPTAGLRVSVFFMLSGFLIFATTWRRRGKLTFSDFMIERSARLWVCLVPALAFSAAVAHASMDLPDYPALHTTGVYAFVGNLLMLEDFPLFQVLRRVGLDSSLFVRPYASAEPYWTLPIEYWLYVVFGYAFFFGYLQRGRPSRSVTLLFAIALFAAMYHGATGHGQCLSLVWAMGALGPWAVPFERKLQQHFRYSDRTARLLIVGWLGFWFSMLALRIVSRGIYFYELQVALFVGAILMGLLWLTGRVHGTVSQPVARTTRAFAKQTYALYLTHNAVLTFYMARAGTELAPSEAVLLVLSCNLIALPFYWLFDRHHKLVAQWLKSMRHRSAKHDPYGNAAGAM